MIKLCLIHWYKNRYQRLENDDYRNYLNQVLQIKQLFLFKTVSNSNILYEKLNKRLKLSKMIKSFEEINIKNT